MTTAARVLVADDQPDVILALRLVLRDAGFDSDAAASVSEVRDRLAAASYDLLLMDLNYARDTTSGREGLDLLAEVHTRDPLLPVVVMTGWGSIDTAVEAMRRGARTFVHKPWDNATLADTLRREVADGRASRAAERFAAREQTEAQAIQRALLPLRLPSAGGLELAARWEPALAFGGDYYDALTLDDSRVTIAIGDVCGKGLPAAFVMSHLQAAARAAACADPSPERLAARINRELVANPRLRRLVTAFWALFDTTTRRLTFCNAGHNPPFLLRRDGSLPPLTTGGMVLGAYADVRYEAGEVVLESGDRLLCYTDGITDAEATSGEPFGDERLLDALRRHAHLPAAPLCDAIYATVERFAGGRFHDDATLLVGAIR